MKKMLFVSAALAALVATPALAQNYHSRDTSWNGRDALSAQSGPRGAYARSYRDAMGGFSTQVIADGKVIGADPDANVRLELRRDAESSDY